MCSLAKGRESKCIFGVSCLSVRICLSVCLSVYLLVCLLDCLSVCLSVCLPLMVDWRSSFGLSIHTGRILNTELHLLKEGVCMCCIANKISRSVPRGEGAEGHALSWLGTGIRRPLGVWFLGQLGLHKHTCQQSRSRVFTVRTSKNRRPDFLDFKAINQFPVLKEKFKT